MNTEERLKISELEMLQSNAMLEWMTNLAKTLFTTLIMINGGAIISLLTFIGNSNAIKTFSGLWVWAISCFCLGIFFILIAMCNAFFAQKIFREGLDKDIVIGKETKNEVKIQKGIKARSWSILCTILSIVSFILGSFISIKALGDSFI